METDAKIDSAYYAGIGNYYCLASPSARDSESLVYVYNSSDGVVSVGYYSRYSAFCPLVSLQPDVKL